MDFTKIETDPIKFANWEVLINKGTGQIRSIMDDEVVAKFLITKEGRVIQFEGETKFSDMALVALRSFCKDSAQLNTCVG